MEAPKDTLRSVHVLRHTFLPSESLQERLENFVVQNERILHPSFYIHSNYEVAVDSEEYTTRPFEQVRQTLEKDFITKSGGVVLQAAGYRFQEGGALALRFGVRDPRRLRAIVAPIDTLPGVIDRSNRTVETVLKLQINARALAERHEVADAWKGLRGDLQALSTTSVLYVQPHKLSATAVKVVRAAQGDRVA